MHREVGLSRRVAAALEAGASGAYGASGGAVRARLTGPLLLGVASAWGERARLAAPLDWYAPSRTLITVGGATLGGDGKTRLAIACVSFLAERGVRVALVGHGYRASPGRARIVSPADSPQVVGDEALVAARRLAGAALTARAPVLVAPERAAAVDLAFRHADVVVLDGPLQVAPVPASLAVLVQSADAPWGAAGLCPPCGDLRASRERLVAHSDLQVQLPDAEPEVHLAGEDPQSLATFAAVVTREGRRIGLFTALARPARLVARLSREGITPVVHLEAPDHGGMRPGVLAALPRLARAHRVDLWLATDKCSSSLALDDPALSFAPLARMVPRPESVPPALAARLVTVACLPRS